MNARRRGTILWSAAAVVALVLAAPRVETLPGTDVIEDDPPAEMLVRVVGDGPGAVLVYDKRRNWVRAKAAEIFPRIARGTLPADYAADASGRLTVRRVEVHVPWWR